MKIFNKGILGKVSSLSIFLVFILFVLILVNMSIANPLVSSYEKSFFCDGCNNLEIPSETEVDVFLNVSVVHFKDESEKITLIDILPNDWDIINSDDGKVATSNFYKTIEWNIDLTKNKKLYESDSYEIFEIQKLYTIKSPFVTESKTYSFTSKIDEEIGTTQVNVYPLENYIEVEPKEEFIENIVPEIKLNSEQTKWKEKLENMGSAVSIIKTDIEKYTAKIEKNNVIVEFEEIENVNWNKIVELTQNVNKEKINEFLSKDNLKLEDFVWVNSNDFIDKENYNAKIILPSTYESVIYCEGTEQNPYCSMIEECGERPCYEEINGKTILYLNHFSGGGGADPTNQYNQDNSPLIVKGTWSAGSAINLNALGEGATYDVQEALIGSTPSNRYKVQPIPLSSFGTSTTLDVDISDVNLDHAFIVKTQTSNSMGESGCDRADESIISVSFFDSNTLRYQREATACTPDVTGYVVEALDNQFTVYNCTMDFAGASTTATCDITGIVDTDWSMVIGSCNADGANTQLHQADVRFELSDFNTVQGTRAVTGSTPTCHVFVVEWSSSFVGAVYHNIYNSNGIGPFYDSIGASVNTSSSLYFSTFDSSSNGLEPTSQANWLENETHVGSRQHDSGYSNYISWYVIANVSGAYVQNGNWYNNTATSIQDATINAVEWNRSYVFSTGTTRGDGTAGSRQRWANYNLTSTSVRWEMGNPAATYSDRYEFYQVVQLPYEEGFDTYQVEVWHNSTQISFTGDLVSINATLNFTTDTNDDYSLQIYDWANSQWTSTDCDSGSILANTPTQWWCNITTNPMNYNSSNGIVRIRINSTEDTDQGLLKEDYVQYYVSFMDYVPTWYDNSTSVASGSEYLTGRNYGFEIKWDDPDQGDNVDTVFFEWNGDNYTEYTTPAVQNSGNVYWINLTDLGVGDYNYKWFANDSYDFWNVTDTWVYSIVKNTSTQDLMNLTLGIGTSGTESNYQDTYPAETNATGWHSSVFDGQDITFNLYRNDSLIGSSNPVSNVETYGVGFYIYIYNTSGNENYTSGSKNYNLTIQQNQTNPVNLYFRNETGEYLNQNITVNYENQTNATGATVHSNSGPIYLFRDEINVTDTDNNQLITLGANTDGYAYKVNTSGNENYSSNDTGITYYIIVNLKQTTTYLWINSTRSNYGFTQDDYANFTVELVGYPSENVELWTNYSDGIWKLWDSGVSPYENITQLTTTGTFEFLGNYSGDENYTYSEESWIVKVSSLSLVSTIASMSPTSINQSKNSTVVGNCSCEGGTCNNVYIEIQADGSPIPSTYGSDLQINGSSSYSLGQLSDSWATRSWNITGWVPGTYEIKIKCNSTETGNSFSNIQNLEVNDTENPTWSGNATSHSSGIEYLKDRQYQFNVTWNDNKQIDKVLIEHNFTGGVTPHNDTVTTHENGVYYFDVSDLATGTYVWKEYANDTTDNQNVTNNDEYWIFTVEKGPTEVSLYLYGSTSDQTSYYPNSTINATAVSNVSELYVQIWRNGTLIANSTGSTFNITQWPAWNNNFTAQVLGNENNTDSSPVTLWWNVSKGPVSLLLENNVSWSATYPASTNTTASGCALQLTCNLSRNDSGLIGSSSSPISDIVLLAAGGYNYTYNTSGNENYSANATSNVLTIYKSDAQPTLSINTTWSEIYPTATNVSCSVSSFNDEVTCIMYRNDTGQVTNPDENILGAGVYEYITNTSETENYSANATGEIQILTISENPISDIDLFLNGSQSNININYNTYLNTTAVLVSPSIGNIEIWTNYSGGWYIWDSCTDCSSLENLTNITQSGIWNFTANFTNANYTSAYESWYANVKDLVGPTYSDNSTNSTSPGSPVEHRLKWQDNVDLSGYIFQFCNGTWDGIHCRKNASSIYETGVISNVNGWTVVSLSNVYTNPVVIVTGQQGADISMDVEASRPKVDNVTSNSFQVIVINDFGNTVTENVGYIVMETGHHTIDGVEVEAGTYSVTTTTAQVVNFIQEFPSNTVVIDTIQNNTIDAASSRYTIDTMTTGNYTVYWEGFDTNSNIGPVTAGYIAVEKGNSSSLFESGIYESCAADPSDGQWCSVSFNNSYSTVPIVFLNPISESGGDPCVTGRKSLDSDSVDIRTTEGRTDAEQTHNTVDLPWIIWTNTNDGWQNDTWQPMTGETNWSNVTKIINSTEGANISWCVYANDSADNWNRASCDDPFSYIAASIGYLEVELFLPPGNTLVERYRNFTVNATVYCRDDKCANVYGIVRYNLTSQNPDTPVNITYGEEPFFINETPANALKTCLNDMQKDDFCNVTWNINATGDLDSEWKIGVLFNSSYSSVDDNHTSNITITIVSCVEEITLQFSSIGFGNLLPNINGSAALGNSGKEYNVTNSGSCLSDIWLKASNLVNDTNEISYSNITFNNVTDDYGSAYRIGNAYSFENSSLEKNVVGSTNVTGYYFLDVPPIYAGMYSGNITFCLNSSAYPSLCE